MKLPIFTIILNSIRSITQSLRLVANASKFFFSKLKHYRYPNFIFIKIVVAFFSLMFTDVENVQV